MIVKSYSEKVREAYQCREVLELLAIRLAIGNIDDEGILKLEELLEKTKQVNTLTEIVNINSKIHNIIVEYSGNKKLKQLLDSVSDIILHDRNITAFNPDRFEKIHSEHIEIIKALKERNVEKAEAAMKIHIKNGLKYIIEQQNNRVKK